MAGDRTLTVKILGDASGAQKAFGQLEKDSDGIGSKLAGVGAAVGKVFLGAGVAASAFGVKAVLSASDLAETMSKVGVVFGDQQKIVTNFANQMAKDFGTPKREILDAASSIGLIGKASGLSQGDAAKMSTQLAKMAADASSFYNVPLPEALQAIQSGLVGEAEPMRRFGVLLNAQAVDAEAARLGLEKVGKEYTEGAKAQARASLIMSGMTDASGDLERTQGSLANRIKELKGRAANFAADVGTKLLPVVLKAMDVFERLSGVLTAKVGPILRTVSLGLKALVAAFQEGDVTSDGFVGAMERLGVAARQVFDFFRSEVLPVLSAVAGFIKDNLAPVLAAVGAVVASVVVPAFIAWATATKAAALVALTAAAPAIALGAAVAALAAGVVYAYQNFDAFREAVDNVASFITTKVAPVIAKFAGYLVEQLGAAVEWVKRMWPQISESIHHVMNVAAGIIRSTIDVVSALWRAWGDDLLRIVKTAFEYIRGTIDNVLQVIRGVIQTVLAIINGDWGRAWDGIKQILAGIWDQMTNVVRTALGLVQSILGGTMSTIAGIWSAAWGGIKDAGAAVLREFVGIFLGIVENIVGAAARAFGWVPGIGPKLKEAARSVESFRDETNAALGGIKDKDVVVRFKTLNGAEIMKGQYGGKIGDGEGLENTSGIGKGYQAAIASLKGSGIPYGVSSTLRPFAQTSSGNLSLHALGKAVDFTGPNKGAIANWFLQQASSLRELIYTPLGFSIKNGQRVAPIAASDHYDHVHVGTYHSGGIVGGGPDGAEVLARLQVGEGVIDRNTMRSAGSGSAVAPVVNNYFSINVGGSVTSETDLVDRIHEGLLKLQRRNGTLGLV